MAKYDRNDPFNELPLLPTPQEVENDSDILKKLVKASRALASVNSNVLRLPNPDMLINTIGLQEAKTSTAIENIFTTEDELYKAISDTAGRKKQSRDKGSPSLSAGTLGWLSDLAGKKNDQFDTDHQDLSAD